MVAPGPRPLASISVGKYNPCSGAGSGSGHRSNVPRGAGGSDTSAGRPVVRFREVAGAALGCAAVFVAGCAEQPGGQGTPISTTGAAAAAEVEGPTRIEPGDGAANRIQAALINAKAGDVIELGAGRFDCRATLSLDKRGVTV